MKTVTDKKNTDKKTANVLPITSDPRLVMRVGEGHLEDAAVNLADATCIVETILDATERDKKNATHVTLIVALQRLRETEKALAAAQAQIREHGDTAKPKATPDADVNAHVQCKLIDVKGILQIAIDSMQANQSHPDVEYAISGAKDLLDVLEKRFDGELHVFEVEG